LVTLKLIIIIIIRALRSETNQKRWMALDRASYHYRMLQGTV